MKVSKVLRGKGPPLLNPDGTRLTREDAREVGFDFQEVYESSLQYNSRNVEASLQYLLHHLPLGVRLWRCPDKGAHSAYQKKDNRLHRVFVTACPVESSDHLVNHGKKK